MSSKKQITIIGATGNIGIPVVKNLLSFGYSVKVIVRNEEKAKKLFSKLPDVEIVNADLKDIPALQKALKGTQYLYLNLSTQTTDINTPFASEREGVANIIEAIDRKSIKQIISISGLGAFDNLPENGKFRFIPNVIRKQGQKIIKESGIPFTFLHCSWFADSFIFYQRNQTYAVIGNTKDLIYFTNSYDFSLNIANAIDNPEALFKEFPVQGNEGIKHPEAAQLFLSVYSKNAKVKILPAWIINMLAMFKKEMKFLKQMSDYFHNSIETFLAEDCDTYKVLGAPKLSLSAYASKLKTENFYDYLQIEN